MKRLKDMLLRFTTCAVFAVAVTTVASTSRVLAYQPDLDAKVMKKYLNK